MLVFTYASRFPGLRVSSAARSRNSDMSQMQISGAETLFHRGARKEDINVGLEGFSGDVQLV